jgi:hypothetical protein
MRRSSGIWALILCGVFLGGADACAQPAYPDLWDSHDPELQAELDEAFGKAPGFWEDVRKREFGSVVVDVTDLRRPRVASYNPELMLYAASLPKIAIVLGIFVEVDGGALMLDDETRAQLIRTVRNSSNRGATALLHKVGFERLAEIFGDPAIKHKFVKGLEDREGVRIYRKSGTWRNFHADSAVVDRDDHAYIAVSIDQHPKAGHHMVDGIRIVDDVMSERARRGR